jgi:hypothetical protein
MQSKASTVEQYLASLPKDRREAIDAVRKVVLRNLPKGVEETMQYGMIGYVIPHSIYPKGYHRDTKQPLPFAGLASQKSHMSLYLFGIYIDSESSTWLMKSAMEAGKKLDMGKSCIRFKKLDALPLDLIGKAVKRHSVKDFIRIYESNLKR